MYIVTYAGKSAPEKATDFAATTRYKPLHFNSYIPTQHILNRFVENIGVSVFSDALRLVSDALKSGSDALAAYYDDLTLADDAPEFEEAFSTRQSAFSQFNWFNHFLGYPASN